MTRIGTTAQQPAPAMMPAEFAAALDRAGGRIERWDAEARARAERLLADDAEAARAFAAQARVERVLAAVTAPRPVDAAFVGGVLARVRGAARPQRIFRLTPRFAAAGATGLMLCFVVGIAMGLVVPGPAAADDSQDLAVLVLGVGADDADMLAGGLL